MPEPVGSADADGIGDSAGAALPVAPDVHVTCGGARHRLRLLRPGTVVLDAHPDVDAERALVAFGGVAPACLERLGLWEDAVGDGGFLGEWARVEQIPWARISWLVTAIERTRSEGVHEYLPRLGEQRAARMGEFVVSFPGPWLDRAAVEVARRVVTGAGVACSLAPGLLDEAVARRLRQAFVRSLGGRGRATGVAALVPLRPLVGTGVAPAVAGSVRGRASRVDITVDRRWLVDVWGRGAAVVEGQLVLALEDRRAQVVRWAPDGGALVPVLEDHELAGDESGWRLAR